MTKKSYGRQQRDANKKVLERELATNNNWGQLQDRYLECRDLLLMHLGIGNVLENPEIRAEITPDNHKKLVDNIGILTRDLTERVTELNMIFKTHSDKFGSAGEDDIMLSFEIMEKYTQWLALMQSVVQPTAAVILEITSIAEKAVLVKQMANAAQDPNNQDPIDVEFTEATPSDRVSNVLNTEIAKADHTNPQPE